MNWCTGPLIRYVEQPIRVGSANNPTCWICWKATDEDLTSANAVDAPQKVGRWNLTNGASLADGQQAAWRATVLKKRSQDFWVNVLPCVCGLTVFSDGGEQQHSVEQLAGKQKYKCSTTIFVTMIIFQLTFCGCNMLFAVHFRYWHIHLSRISTVWRYPFNAGGKHWIFHSTTNVTTCMTAVVIFNIKFWHAQRTNSLHNTKHSSD